MRLTHLSILALLGSLGALACTSASRVEVAAPVSAPTLPVPGPETDQAVDYPGLRNVVAYGNDLYSGSQPEEGGLETLAAMGIRTVISVDGAQPDVEGAEALGLRYVHLPIGYDGIVEERTLELARAARDLPGPIYVHCHHGRHRSAGAASAIGIALGRFDGAYATERMKVSGTASNYTGLWSCATDTRPATNAEIDAASNAFPSRWKTTGMVQNMVEVDAAYENMKDVEKAGWTTPANHPDLVPAAEVGRIAHLLRELRDDPEARAHGQAFLDLALAAEKASDAVQQGLVDGLSGEELRARFKRVGQSCKDCHAKHRD
jgi:protein tyrosine phosphatase (PTP) superfamily phosphohydrolase (DUF442 family)